MVFAETDVKYEVLANAKKLDGNGVPGELKVIKIINDRTPRARQRFAVLLEELERRKDPDLTIRRGQIVKGKSRKSHKIEHQEERPVGNNTETLEQVTGPQPEPSTITEDNLQDDAVSVNSLPSDQDYDSEETVFSTESSGNQKATDNEETLQNSDNNPQETVANGVNQGDQDSSGQPTDTLSESNTDGAVKNS